MQPLSDRARGRWKRILPELGIPPECLTGKHGPCPLCGGTDRWRWDNKDGRGTWICNKCGAGDGVTLIMRKLGLDFKETIRLVEPLIGNTRADKQKAPQTSEQKREFLNKVWCSGKPVQRDDPAGLYLFRRCGVTEFSRCLRYVPNLRYTAERPTFHPGMIAMVTRPDGAPANLHRTYLTEDGFKAAVEAPRRMMPGIVARGSAVRLAEPTDVLGIAEGIETALSVSALFAVPCWAALNAAMLAAWEPPSGPARIIVFGDNDPGFAGQAAAYALARRIAGGTFAVEVRIPAKVGTDWNDVHCRTAENKPNPTEGLDHARPHQRPHAAAGHRFRRTAHRDGDRPRRAGAQQI